MKNKLSAMLLIVCIILSSTYIMTGARETKSVLSGNIEKLDTSTYNTLYTGDELIAVNIVGNVASPDIYILNKGANINNLINIAGGITKNANLDDINLDKKLNDKDVIIIPSLEMENTENTKNNLININTGGELELISLPEIGETTAKRIIEYRENVSLFYKKTDIKNVKGIGDKTYDKIKDLITI